MIAGQSIKLSALERKHLDQTRAWANNPEIARLMDRARPVSEQEHEQWFSTLHQRPNCIYFAIERISDQMHIGNVWLWEIDNRHRKAEVRIVIGDSECQEKGAGTQAISLISQFAFDRLNLHKVYAFVLATNPRAKRAFEKTGFVVEGVLRQDRWVEGHYSDVFLLGKLAQREPGHSEKPL